MLPWGANFIFWLGLNPTNNQPTNQAKPSQTTDWPTNRLTDKPTDRHSWGRVLPEKLTDPQLVKKFPTFMEPEDSLPHSLEPATCPGTEPAQSIPCLPSHFLKNHFNIILPSMPMSSISLGLLSKTLCAPLLFPICATCPPHLILVDWIFGIDCGAPYYVVFCTPLLPHSSWTKVSSLAAYFRMTSVYIPLSMWPIFKPTQNSRQNYSSLHLTNSTNNTGQHKIYP